MQDESHSFVVRVWRETVDARGEDVIWRGSIDHIGANKRLYFADLDAVRRFIEERVGMAVRSRSPWAAFRSGLRRLLAKDRGR